MCEDKLVDNIDKLKELYQRAGQLLAEGCDELYSEHYVYKDSKIGWCNVYGKWTWYTIEQAKVILKRAIDGNKIKIELLQEVNKIAEDKQTKAIELIGE